MDKNQDWTELEGYMEAYMKLFGAVDLFLDSVRLMRDATGNLAIATVRFYKVAWTMRKAFLDEISHMTN